MKNSTEGDEKWAYPVYNFMAELTGFSERADVESERRSGVEESAHLFFWPEQQEASMRQLNIKSSAQCLACSWCSIYY